jgi:hypothetical protein
MKINSSYDEAGWKCTQHEQKLSRRTKESLFMGPRFVRLLFMFEHLIPPRLARGGEENSTVDTPPSEDNPRRIDSKRTKKVNGKGNNNNQATEPDITGRELINTKLQIMK